ncbi:MAG: isoprenylcysteine carboxylmethyltransferase family protein [Acidobacteriota bacterium]|nr:isoprenylcysteine carboxylmethyltransferase family protein [Acidobacteriota bacterium]MDE2923134.1 isoprenylcysteine carboxylmethyltransferase family protein [Acidobacteriota bacterium]MDE3265995.1 isoprenylcysteine carboxylmethyltransferase family protein [Acidobacteriota bacterium]
MATGGEPDRAQTAFTPPLLVLVGLVLGFGLSWLLPLRIWPAGTNQPLVVAGVAIVVASFAWLSWSALTMVRGGSSLPVHHPTANLVIRGPYRWSRNPIYAGMVLAFLGLGLTRGSWWFVVLAVAVALLLRWGVILREEAYLERKFGDEYRDYAKRVRRWL